MRLNLTILNIVIVRCAHYDYFCKGKQTVGEITAERHVCNAEH